MMIFFLTFAVLIPLLASSNDPPPLPNAGKSLKCSITNYNVFIYTYNNIGVQFYGAYNNISYPNISVIPANYFYGSNENALWCQSARNESNIGVWYYPNGTQVSTVDDSSPLHSVHMSGQIGLYRDYGLVNLEGIYTCVIPDESNVNQTLLILLYKEYTYRLNSELIELTINNFINMFRRT